MLQEGVHVAGGSDAPIEHPNPFMGMHAAIFSHDRQGTGFITTNYKLIYYRVK